MADRYSGSVEHTIDAKGRIMIPARFRDQLGNDITIAYMPDHGDLCLRLYSRTEWNNIFTKYENVDEDVDRELFNHMRKLMMSSEENNVPDKQGRLNIPPMLRERVQLEKEIVICGAGRHVEVWSKENYLKFLYG